MESLKKPDGWLSLAGLYWLEPGENSFGDDPANDIVFPADKVPAFIGSFTLQDTTVSMRINPGIPVYYENQPVTQLVLKNDLSDKPTILNYGSLSWYIIRRGDKYGVRRGKELPGGWALRKDVWMGPGCQRPVIAPKGPLCGERSVAICLGDLP